MSLIIAGTKSKVRELKEINCWAFNFHTQELSSEQFKKLIEFDFCKLLLSDENITDEMKDFIESEPIKVEGKYSKSQLLRFTLNDIQPGEDFYNSEMDKIIKHYKSKVA